MTQYNQNNRGNRNVEFSHDETSEEIITEIKRILLEIEQAPTPQIREHKLYDLSAFLISKANDIAQKQDFYEAAGRLYSAAYYLENIHPDQANLIYQKAIQYYIKYYNDRIQKGVLNEASNVALKIAEIYHLKLNNREEEQHYIDIAINNIEDQITLLEVSESPRELCAKYHSLAVLYANEKNWEKVQTLAKKAIKLAKEINDYTMISNAYNDLIKALGISGSPEKAENYIFEAIDYFSKKAEDFEDQNDLLALAQIYQIIKNFYIDLKIEDKIVQFGRKEANTYIILAEQASKEQHSIIQVASYYRGAALCYQNLRKHELDAASCYFLAGNYYHQAKRSLDAATNYEDAAKIFERRGNYKKATELLANAGELAIKVFNYEIAIEYFIWAYETSLKGKIDPRKALNLLIKYLKNYSLHAEKNENYFVAGTLKLESIYYCIKLSQPEICPKSKIIATFNDIFNQYSKFVDSLSSSIQVKSMDYVLALMEMVAIAQKKESLVLEIENRLSRIKSINADNYIILIHELKKKIANREIEPLQFMDSSIEELYQQSQEIQRIAKIIEFLEDF
ncbi:MAG: hypothetical protein ACTSVU_03440 [Promethearchaeota archaeon]